MTTLPHFDWTLRVSDILIFGAGIWAFTKVFLTNRDILRDLVKGMHDLKEMVERVNDRLELHHEWLIRSGLDRIDVDAHDR